VARGLRGRCPACGKGRLFSGYLAQALECGSCGEDLSSYRTADFAPYLVTFAIGLVFTPLALVLSASPYSSALLVPLLALLALACAAVLLPRAKGAALALLWALDDEQPTRV
jgi:uncharacterized protein (DUF983 family)